MLAPGNVFAHYRVETKLGEGNFGAVFRAEDLRLHRKVALKVLHARIAEDPEAWGRLLSEARAASALNDPHICALYDIGEEDGLGYIAMEYVEGRNLSDILRAGPLPAGTALRYSAQMAGALAHAHGRGIIHRDLKAANVIISAEDQVKLLDFGLARRLDSQTIGSVSQSRQSLTDLGGLAGTLCYMAPEVLRGKPADARSDLWSLGALLYETLSGALPFRGETPFELSMAIMVEEPLPLPTRIPGTLRAAVSRCLQKDPERRYATGEQLRAVLETVRTELAVSRWKSRLRSRVLWMTCLALALLVTLGLAWRYYYGPGAGGGPGSGQPVSTTPAKTSVTPPSPPAAAPKSGQAAKHASALSRKFPGNPDTEVWVNARSRIYHCPGSRWYRRTAHGELLKQRQAQLKGYQPASGQACP